MTQKESQNGPEDGGEDKKLLDGLMNVLALERGNTGDVENDFQVYQQDATLYKFLYYCQCCTYSFELLMIGGETA